MKKLLFVFLIFFVFVSCKNAFAVDGIVLKVKGLYLGMNIDDADVVLNNLGYSFQVTELATPKNNGDTYILGTTDSKLLCILADSNKKVNIIYLAAQLVDNLFNTSDLPAKDFVRKFMDSYNIPSMDVVAGDDIVYWRYVSPNGYKVEIYDDKTIRITAVTPASNIKFN